MSVRKAIPDPNGIYFITITCSQWLHLFEITHGHDIVYKWFDHLKAKGHYITGYVIMPNHIHALIGFRNTGKSINSIVGNGKRFMAYELVTRLKQQNELEILRKLSSGVNDTDRSRGKLHEVFEPSFAPIDIGGKECWGQEFIFQKLEYIHANPVSGVWNLVDGYQLYIHSSVKYYYTGEQGI